MSVAVFMLINDKRYVNHIIMLGPLTGRLDPRYVEDLLALDQRRKQPVPVISPALTVNLSLLRAGAWSSHMAMYPNARLKYYIAKDIAEGFWTGFDYGHHSCCCQRRNFASALEHPDIVHEYTAKECAAGRLLGPFDWELLPHVQVSRYSVIPKSTPGKWG